MTVLFVMNAISNSHKIISEQNTIPKGENYEENTFIISSMLIAFC